MTFLFRWRSTFFYPRRTRRTRRNIVSLGSTPLGSTPLGSTYFDFAQHRTLTTAHHRSLNFFLPADYADLRGEVLFRLVRLFFLSAKDTNGTNGVSRCSTFFCPRRTRRTRSFFCFAGAQRFFSRRLRGFARRGRRFEDLSVP